MENNQTLHLATQQEILQKSVDGVNTKIDKVAHILSTARIDDSSEITNKDTTPTLKLTPTDIQLLKEEVTHLKEVMSGFVAEIKSLKQAVTENCNAELKKVKILVNDQDQYNRKNNAMFTSLASPPPTTDPSGKLIRNPNENAIFCQFIANQLNHYLPNLSIPVSLNTIDTAHPLRNNCKGESVVIVRFANRHQKHEILGHKKHLMNFGISVYEQLTPMNVDLLKKTKAKVGALNAWSTNGKIYARTDKGKVHITLDTDLNELTSPPPVEVEINDATKKISRHEKRPNEKEKNSYPRRGRGRGNLPKPPPHFFYGSQPMFMGNNNNTMAHAVGPNASQQPGYSGW